MSLTFLFYLPWHWLPGHAKSDSKVFLMRYTILMNILLYNSLISLNHMFHVLLLKDLSAPVDPKS